MYSRIKRTSQSRVKRAVRVQKGSIARLGVRRRVKGAVMFFAQRLEEIKMAGRVRRTAGNKKDRPKKVAARMNVCIAILA
jgi:hypothetical protein